MIAYDNFDSIIGSPIFFTQEIQTDISYPKNTLVRYITGRKNVTINFEILPAGLEYEYIENDVLPNGTYNFTLAKEGNYLFARFNGTSQNTSKDGSDFYVWYNYSGNSTKVLKFHNPNGTIDDIYDEINVSGTIVIEDDLTLTYTKAIYNENLDWSSLAITCDDGSTESLDAYKVEAFTFGKFNYDMILLDESFSTLPFEAFKNLARASNLYFFQGKMNELE